MTPEVDKIVRRMEHARRTAAAAAAGAPNDAATQNAAAQVYSLAGAHAQALQHWKRAALLAPDNAQYAYNVGAAQQTVGDVTGAALSFRRAIELSLDMARAYYALAQLGGVDAIMAERLKALVRTPDPSGVTQLFAGHALALVREREGDLAGAMRWLAEAKAARAAARPYQLAVERATAEAAIGAPAASGAGHPSEEPIFIVGLPRTGTSLIDRILSSHTDVASAGELSNFPQIIKAMTRTPSALSLDPPTLTQAMRLDLAEVGRAYVESTRPLTGETRKFIDKAPMNYLVARHIHAALPNARIVCVLREPMDACLSLYRQVFPTEHPYYDYIYKLDATARAYVLFREVAARWRAVLPPERYIEVRYEDVVADLEAEARRLVQFCGLDWQDNCLKFHENKTPIATPSSAQVRQPLYATSVGRWRRYGALLDPARNVLAKAGFAPA